MNGKLLRYMTAPILLVLIFVVVATSPVEILGCRLRGLIAVGIAIIGALLGLASMSMAIYEQIRKRPGSGWWIAKGLILALPAIYIAMFEM